ncbi:MAG: hypothetical protein COB78_09360 [Hyphomicrobiales bacterium]|nr:MAG: hypothetical protein COB78_09360 [Hyphomicrobiales bacterium]
MGFATVFRFSSVFLLSAFLSTTAFAFDAAEYVAKIQNMANARGVALRFGSMEPVGDAGFVLNDVSFQGPKGNPPAKIVKIRLEGIEELPGNSFAASLVEFEGFSLVSSTTDDKEIIVTIVGGVGKDVYFADPLQADAPFFHYPRSTYNIADMSVSVGGKNLVTIKSISTDMIFDADAKKQTMAMGVNEIDINLKLGEDPAFNARRKALGYENLLMAIAISGSWDMNTGKVVIDKYSFDAKDAGRLTLSGAISGYTEALAIRFRKLSAELQTTIDPKELQQKNIALLGMMSQLSLDNLEFSYKDASLVDRILDLQSEQMGMPKSDLVRMIPTMLPMFAAPLQNPEFIGALAGNVAKFLNRPGDISISAKPSRSIPFTEIMIAGSTQPHTLIDLLGVVVKANEGK